MTILPGTHSRGIMGAMGAAAFVLLDRLWFFAHRWPAAGEQTLDEPAADALAGLRRDGYATIIGYYSLETCAALCAEIDRIMREQPAAVQRDDQDSDWRVYGAERASPAIAAFHHNSLSLTVGEAYFGAPLVNLATLAGRLKAQAGNLGSGGGWHRDAFHFQYKAMVYLTDVTEETGPFQLLYGSHRARRVFIDTLRGRLDPPPASRLTDAQAARLIGADPARLKSLFAPAGTLILFDSSAIHRGAPIKMGVRYALTNYYFEPKQLTSAMREKFAPYARSAGTV